MRVAIITESFPPDLNGVAHCVQRVAELLVDRGHGAMTMGWWPPAARSSATRTTQCATPLRSGGNDSVMIATLMLHKVR